MICSSLKWTWSFQPFLSMSLPAEHRLAGSWLVKKHYFWASEEESDEIFTLLLSTRNCYFIGARWKCSPGDSSHDTELERATHNFTLSSLCFYAPIFFFKLFCCAVGEWGKHSTAWLKKLENLTTVIIWRETSLSSCPSPHLATALFRTQQSIYIRPMQRLGNTCQIHKRQIAASAVYLLL